MRSNSGVGLAAPQVEAPIQLAVIEDREEYIKKLSPQQIKERQRVPIPFHVFINPIIIEYRKKKLDFYESCLSLAGFAGLVSRAESVIVSCLNELGEPIKIHVEGWYARILQHEIDHLNSRIYIDIMKTQTFTTIDNFKALYTVTNKNKLLKYEIMFIIILFLNEITELTIKELSNYIEMDKST